MSIILEYFIYFLILFALLSIAYCVGGITLKVCNMRLNNLDLRNSISIFIGLIGLTTIFAIFQSHFLSIFLIVPLIFLFYIKTLKFNFSDILPKIYWNWSDFLLLFLLFCLNSFYFIPHSSNLYPGYFGDYFFYADVADSFLAYHKENSFRTANILLLQVLNPYHYFDIWLSAIVSEFTGKPSVVSYVVIVSTILQFQLAVTIKSFFRNKFLIVLLIAGLFATDLQNIIPLDFYTSISNIFTAYSNKFSSFNFLFKALPTVSIFLYIAYIFIKRRGFKYVPLLCSFLLVINIANIFLSGYIYVFYLIYSYFHKISFPKLPNIGYILSVLFIPILYFFISDRVELESFFSFDNFSINEIINSLKYAVGVFISLTAFQLPWLMVLFIYIYKRDNTSPRWWLIIGYITMFTTLLLIGTLISIFLKDGMQFFTNTAWIITGTMLFMGICLISVYVNERISVKAFKVAYSVTIIAVIGVFMYKSIENNKKMTYFYGKTVVDNKYLVTVNAILARDSYQEVNIGSFYKREDFSVEHKKFYSFNPLGSYMKLLAPRAEVINLTAYEVYKEGPSSYTRKTAAIELATLYVKEKNKELPSVKASVKDIHQLMDDMTFHYYIFSDSAVKSKYRFSDFIQKNNLVITDSVTNSLYGETFYRVENK